MTTRHLLLGLLGLTLPMADCSRAGLNAIVPAPGTGGSGTGGSGTGGSGVGGSGVGGSGVGGSGVGGSGVGGSGTGGSGTGGGPGIDGGTGGTTAAACPTPMLPAGDTDQTVQVGGTSRTYVLHIPPKYNGTKPAPLILDFHAQNGTGQLELQGSPYPAKTDPEGVVMAFPSGKGGPAGTAWNLGPCCVNGNPDDLAFARNMVQQVESLACIDKKRVYAVGVATGGGMAYSLACNEADIFAAVAPAGFDLLEETVDACKPSRSITVISFRGTADFLVPYGGGLSTFVNGMPINFLGAKDTFTKWAEIDQCAGNPTTENVGSNVSCSTYSNCKDSAEVILCTKDGGIMEAGNASIAWPVLKRHSLP